MSTFMPMTREYAWCFTTPSDDLRVDMSVLHNGQRELWRYPLMIAQVFGAIHWQALRLWLKLNPSTNTRSYIEANSIKVGRE